MKLFTETAIHYIDKTISADDLKILPAAIHKHTVWDYTYQQKTAGCFLKPTFRNMPYKNSFVPEIDIIISGSDSQTELQMRGQPILLVRVLMTVWFIFVFVLEIFFIFLAITHKLDSLLPVFSTLAMGAFGYFLCKLSMKATFNSVVKALKKATF